MRYAELPLHYGKAPRWLFSRMVDLSRLIAEWIIEEYGEDEFIRRMADPFFFQSFALVVGFDWHSSGTTTTLTGALRLSLRDLPIGIAGGKGKTAIKTPELIKKEGEKINLNSNKVEFLKRASRLTAKVDNACIQDGYTLYHHVVLFSKRSYAVIQQGMKVSERKARRYHWLNPQQFLLEHDIVGIKEKKVLNLIGKNNEEVRKAMVDLAKDLRLPSRHEILPLDLSKRDIEFFKAIKEYNPSSFEEMILFKGMGQKRLRALALISNLVYGNELDWHDPVKYAFAHGGKDGIPFPVDVGMYDKNIALLREALENKKGKYVLKALKRLNEFWRSKV